jgi:hypothetical protein
MKKTSPKKLTTEQKYRSLKSQTERAGMSVKEQNGKLVVSRRKPKKNGR